MILRNYPMATERFNPFSGLNHLHRAMSEIFERFDDENRNARFPAINVRANDEAVTVSAELPGVSADQVDVSVEGDTFTLKGRRNDEVAGENDTWHRRERRQGEFTRIVELPYSVDVDKVQATLRNGILTVHLPRLEAEKPRRIAINGTSA